MPVPKSNFEGILSTYVFGKCFCLFRELKSDCSTLVHLLWEKKLNYFGCVEVRNLVEK